MINTPEAQPGSLNSENSPFFLHDLPTSGFPAFIRLWHRLNMQDAFPH